MRIDDLAARDVEESMSDQPLSTPAVRGHGDETAALAERYACAVVLPLWMAAGSLDYVLHRRARIEATSGLPESRLHLAGIAVSGAPVLAGLLLEIDAGVLGFMLAGYVVHAGMTIWDVAYADARRRVVPLEQHVHALLEILPFTALSLVAVAHRDQARALVGRGASPARYCWRRKLRPISRQAVTALLGAFVVTVAVPYAEEFLRCLCYESEGLVLGSDAPREHREIERFEYQRVPGHAERKAHAR